MRLARAVVATVQPTEEENLVANLPHLQVNDLLYAAGQRAIENLRPTQPSGIVFTDDRAPIELMTNMLIIEYILDWLG